MLPGWLDINASSMCVDEFTPEFMAVHSWSDYPRRVFRAKCKVCTADDVIMRESCCRALQCRPVSTTLHGRAPQGVESEGLSRESSFGWGARGDVSEAAPRLLKMTPEGVTQSWTLHITMSQQAAKERCEKSGENGLRGRKLSLIILDGKIPSVSLSHIPIRTCFPSRLQTEANVNRSCSHLTLFLL